ncbi:MAG: MotA/TolQ/ExbB proton channel family protein [Phycisphaerales bacterium]|nr:MotA/TolQ/ExbB proton channel family protein [Phycisphaerales bacterium]
MRTRMFRRLIGLGTLATAGAAAWAQGDAGAGAPSEGSALMSLFWASADVFTGVIVLGSFLAVAVIVRSLLEIRASVIMPAESVDEIRKKINRADWTGLRQFVETDEAFPSRVLSAAMGATRGRASARDAAELTASEEAARWFRRIEMLNVLGHLGPLLGLVGTVYGMILAFAALGQTGGQAGPGELSLGISKALFHTFLGLMLAIPALFAYGWLRTAVDRICTRAMVLSAELVDSLPDEVFERKGA